MKKELAIVYFVGVVTGAVSTEVGRRVIKAVNNFKAKKEEIEIEVEITDVEESIDDIKEEAEEA